MQISTLSKSERAALAHGSVTMPLNRHDEIMRRMAQVESGQAELLARDEFRQQMRSRMGN